MANEIKLSKINEILSNLDNLSRTYKLLSNNTSSNYFEEKNMGEEGVKVDIYDVGHPEIFLQVVTNSDSYGGNERVSSIQFVVGKDKTITVYEPLK